jgi:threonine dehydratase
MITKDDIDAARARIRRHVRETPVMSSARLGDAAGGVRLELKCESFQKTGSFKARGALNAMMQLTAEEKARGVVTVSAGNHAQALAWASGIVGADCVTVMPEGASTTKVQATKGYGGTVELVAGERSRSFDRARELAAQGRVLVHPFEDDRVAAGQGTVGLELLEQCRDLEAVVVPIGGGGLISGIAVAIKSVNPDIKIFGVEPEGAATMRKSLDAGTPQSISPKTVADGLAAPMVGQMNLDIARRHVDDVILVTDEDIVAALRDVVAYARLVIEPAAAAGVAALLSRKLRFDRGTRVAVVISGGNVDLSRLKDLL